MSSEASYIYKRYDPVKCQFYLEGYNGRFYGTHDEIKDYYEKNYANWFGTFLIDETTREHLFPFEWKRKKNK